MTDFPAYPTAPADNPDESHHRRQIALAANSAVRGKTNNLGEVTLTDSSATTTLTDSRLSYFSAVLFDPLTANAAAELAAGTMYVLTANRGNGVWTITNANNAQTDRTFRYAIFG